MEKELNIILKSHEMDAQEAVVIRRAGYYERVMVHQVHREGPTCMNEAIFLYCLEGTGWLEAGGQYFQIEKGMSIYCDRNAPHSYGTHPQNPWTLLWVHFDGSFSDFFSKSLGSENKCVVLTLNHHANIINHLQEIIKLLKIPDDFLSRLTAYSYLKACLCQILLQEQHKKPSDNLPIQKSIEQSIKIMEQHLNTTLNLDELCHEIRLSKFYFSRSFKTATGLSPMNFFNRLKMQKACTLMTSDTYRIQEISEMLGFSTPYYFSETFKQFTGYSPSAYKKLHVQKY
ncbi:MAG: AraC family transcriptional regulator [Vallitaleaceae bacterium]|nr:AraC family transcriptional regulator [Vallitaleaceae bacterium]